MAVEDLATDLRSHLTDTVGLDLRHDALSETGVLFCICSGPHEGADFVVNSVVSCDLPLS